MCVCVCVCVCLSLVASLSRRTDMSTSGKAYMLEAGVSGAEPLLLLQYMCVCGGGGILSPFSVGGSFSQNPQKLALK